MKTWKFEEWFGETYIEKNPSLNKKRYQILRFNFSGIDTETEETTIKGLKNETVSSIKVLSAQMVRNTKKGTETVVDRIFITGVARITLDSLTLGFNVSKNITQDIRFNEIMAFTKQELMIIVR